MSTRGGVLASFLVLIAIGTSAQSDSTRSRLQSFASLHVGALFAEGGMPYPSFTLMSGVAVDRVNISVGAGYDGYDVWKTMPVFVGVGWDAVRFLNTVLYAHVNGGYTNAWHAHMADPVDGGYFVHPQIGYRVRQGRLDLHMSVGYKFQRLEYRRRVPAWGGWGAPDRTRVVQDMERVSVQLGIGLRSR